jgi:hypothetical protein
MLACCSCVERVYIDTNSQAPKLVVMAMLTTNAAPQMVTLTQSTSYFGGDTCPPVLNAKVWINDEQLTLSDAGKGAYAARSTFTVTPGERYTLRILCDMNGDGADEEFWAEEVAPHRMSMPTLWVTPFNMDSDTSKYAPPFVVSALIQRENISNIYMRVTEYYLGRQRTEKLSQYAIGAVPYDYASLDLIPTPMIGTITRSGFLLDGGTDTAFYCPFETVHFQLNSMSEALYRYVLTAQAESRGSANPMFGGAPANAESNIHGDNVVGCFGIYATGTPAAFVLPMNTKTLDGDNEWFNQRDSALHITIRNEGVATYATGPQKGKQYFKMEHVDASIKGFWASQEGGIAKFEMKSYNEFWDITNGEKWMHGNRIR